MRSTNTGTIDLYGNGTNQAALKVSGAAGFGTAGVISGQVNCRATPWCSLARARSSSIASGGQLALDGANAQVQISGDTANNNALTGLSSNAGTFYLRNGASLTTTTGLNNSDDLLLDYFGGDGGASLSVGGTLTNSNLVQIGNTGLSANTTLSADGGREYRDHRPLRQRDQPGGAEGLGCGGVWHRRGDLGAGQSAGQHLGAVWLGRADQHRFRRAIVARRARTRRCRSRATAPTTTP